MKSGDKFKKMLYDSGVKGQIQFFRWLPLFSHETWNYKVILIFTRMLLIDHLITFRSLTSSTDEKNIIFNTASIRSILYGVYNVARYFMIQLEK